MVKYTISEVEEQEGVTWKGNDRGNTYLISEVEEEEGVTYGQTPKSDCTTKDFLFTVVLMVSIFGLIFLAHYFGKFL